MICGFVFQVTCYPHPASFGESIDVTVVKGTSKFQGLRTPFRLNVPGKQR